MRRKILRSMLWVISITAVVAMLSVLILHIPLMEEELLQELDKEADLILQGMDLAGLDYLRGYSDDERRVTLIGRDGRVLWDSDADAGALDNHLDRQEIRQALREGEGNSIRFSHTLTERTINHAERLSDGTILRISVRHDYVLTLLSWLVPPILAIAALIWIVSALLSRQMTQNILAPLYEIDLEHPEECEVYEELRPLTRRIGKQNRQLKETLVGELRKQQRRQSEYTSNMAHELKTPLTSISGFAELMQQEDLDPDTVRDFADSIHKEAGRLIRLVADIIRLAEIDEQGGSLPVQKIALRDLAFRAAESLALSAEKKHVSLRVCGVDVPGPWDRGDALSEAAIPSHDLHSHLRTQSHDGVQAAHEGAEDAARGAPGAAVPSMAEQSSNGADGLDVTVCGEARILQEMIYNLLDNGIRYNVEHGSVELRLEEREEHVCLSVRDTGIGIPREEQALIFERFYRADPDRLGKEPGTGLGLSIVRQGAALHRAEILVESAEGKGTEITLFFPKAK